MPENHKPIIGKIAKILSERNVVINRGSKDEVKRGMRFRVRLNVGTITDPDDATSTLGGLSFTKGRINVISVYDRMSYCAIEPNTIVESLNKGLGAFMKYPGVDVDEPLVITEKDWRLRKGDEVKEIVPPDEKEESEEKEEMSIRIDVQLDHGSESLRYVATATQNGKFLHEIGKYGGPEVCNEVFREMADWLKDRGHPTPDHYWMQQFPS